MGNAVGSVVNGVGQVIGNILGHPLEFLSGKSCESKCGSTWDVICYIENFCVSHLLKLAMVAMLVYFVLLFLYLLFNLGICQCICQTLCRIIRTFFSTYFSAFQFCCSYLCHKLRAVKRNRRRRRRRRRDVEEFVDHPSSSSGDDYELGETSSFQQKHRNHENGRSQVSRRKDYKNERLRRFLRPNTHRAHVELSGDSIHLHRKRCTLKNIGDHSSPIHHHLRVTRSSKFSQKGSRHRARIHHRRKAKYIVGTVAALQSKPGGVMEWLASLRKLDLQGAIDGLSTLPGVGPKVPACVALFSLDQHHAIPVDTHVWQIATRYLIPELAGTRLTPKICSRVAEAFVSKYGKYAGWAQTLLFISELPSQKAMLPSSFWNTGK